MKSVKELIEKKVITEEQAKAITKEHQEITGAMFTQDEMDSRVNNEIGRAKRELRKEITSEVEKNYKTQNNLLTADEWKKQAEASQKHENDLKEIFKKNGGNEKYFNHFKNAVGDDIDLSNEKDLGAKIEDIKKVEDNDFMFSQNNSNSFGGAYNHQQQQQSQEQNNATRISSNTQSAINYFGSENK